MGIEETQMIDYESKSIRLDTDSALKIVKDGEFIRFYCWSDIKRKWLPSVVTLPLKTFKDSSEYDDRMKITIPNPRNLDYWILSIGGDLNGDITILGKKNGEWINIGIEKNKIEDLKDLSNETL